MSFTFCVKTKTIKSLRTYNMNSFTMDSMIDQDQLCFAQPFTMTLAGGRRTGKTYFTKTLLERNRHLLSSPTLETIIWFYGASQQSIFDELIGTMQEYGQRIEFSKVCHRIKLCKISLVIFRVNKN